MPALAPDLIVGQPLDRVDGRLKVMGGAKYAAEFLLPDLAYGVLVTSTAAKGRMAQIDTREAENAPGVLLVMTHLNAPKIPGPSDGGLRAGMPDKKMSLLQSDAVRYQNEPIGVVVADTFERAVHAATMVRIKYEGAEKPLSGLETNLSASFQPSNANKTSADTHRGDFTAGWSLASSKIEAIYRTPLENHHPMEPHATTAVWEGERLTVYDASQGVHPHQQRLAMILGLKPENVRVITYFVGGGFGCKGSMWSHTVLAAMASRQVGKPVKLVLSRNQMAGPVGFRAETRQDIKLGTGADGKLIAMQHAGTSQTSTFDTFTEPVAKATRMLYVCSNQETSHRLVRLDEGTPCQMRAPGEASGVYALECAMDELAYELKVDPIELRLRNYAEEDPEEKKPFSSKSLKECYRLGAEKFGWEKRNSLPRSTKEGNLLIGYGMATATYPVNMSKASAIARLHGDGTAEILTGSQDLGTGTYTILTQIAADALGLPTNRIKTKIGDSILPDAPVAGGSQSAATVGSAVQKAALALRDKLIALALADTSSPLQGATPSQIIVREGHLFVQNDEAKSDTYVALLKRAGQASLEEKGDSKPSDEKQKLSMHSFGAQFAEVSVDPDFGEIRVRRLLGAYGVGKVLNAKTARSQLMGGMVMALGAALLEHTVMDEASARPINPNLAEYHVPVNADVPVNIETFFVDEEDYHINPIGVKGVGELGITGAAAAIANAIYHATGRRIRELPITPDKVML